MKNFDSQMIRILFMAISAILIATPARAQNSLSERFEFKPGAEGAYEPREFSFDLAGFYATRNKGGQPEDAGGLAGGVNYFFLRNWGVGVDTYADAFEAPYLLNASGIFRYPVPGTGLGPYGFAGFGRQWEHAAQWQGHLGAGLEYRLNPYTGVFVDGRRVFPDRTRDFAVWRFGLRFCF